MTDDRKIEVRDNRDRFRYEIVVDGVVAGFLQYSVRGGRIVLSHTEVPDANAGQGLATQLVRGALDDIRKRGLRIVPVCRFVERFVSRNPEYDDLVDHEMFDTLNREPQNKG
jgi:predicted GNAT family acetyltransferase